MLQLRVFLGREYRDYALFGVEFLAEILSILAEILRKKLATGASGCATLSSSLGPLSTLMAPFGVKTCYDF